jgi:hypothetical protein
MEMLKREMLKQVQHDRGREMLEQEMLKQVQHDREVFSMREEGFSRTERGSAGQLMGGDGETRDAETSSA